MNAGAVLFASLVVFLGLCVNASAGGVANGYPCQRKSDCASNYCYPGPFDTNLCIAQKANCTIPGGWGVKFEGEYNFGGKHWFCRTGVGLQTDGPARPPEFYFGGSCSGFWKKIDCRGKWFNEVFRGVKLYCSAANDPYSKSFCAAAEFTAHEYGRQMK